MTRRDGSFRLLTRFSLLLAALLFLGDGAAGPWAHLAALEVDAAAQADGDAGEPASDRPAQDHHKGCAFCYSQAQVPVEAPVAAGIFGRIVRVAVASPSERAYAPPLRARQQARAPPPVEFE